MKIVYSFFLLCIALKVCGVERQMPLQRDPQQLVDYMANRYMMQNLIPGMAIAVFNQGKSSVSTYGIANRSPPLPVSPDTIFELGSVTKVFTATELALQITRGRMLASDPITFYLRGIDKYRGSINFVTLLQLATHTSGLPHIPPPLGHYSHSPYPYTQHQVINFVQHWTPPFRPGTRYLYSNVGYGLLGYALERLERNSYENIIKKDILQPLEMSSTMINLPSSLFSHLAQGYTPDNRHVGKRFKNAWPAAGALRSTIEDMLKFLKANLGVGDNMQLLYAMQMAQQGYFKVTDAFTIALGWQKISSGPLLIVDKNGGIPGYASYIGMVPSLKVGIVILANKSHIQIAQFGRELLKQIAIPLIPPPPTVMPPPPATVE